MLCRGEDVPPWECNAVVADVALLPAVFNFSFQFIRRSGNGGAHWLASRAADLLSLGIGFLFPPALSRILSRDCLFSSLFFFFLLPFGAFLFCFCFCLLCCSQKKKEKKRKKDIILTMPLSKIDICNIKTTS